MSKRVLQMIMLLLLIVLFVLPVGFMFIKSFTFSLRWPSLIPDTFTLRAWAVIWQDPQLTSALQTTLIIGVSVVVLNMILATPAAYVLSHFYFRGKAVVETIILLPLLIPVLAIAMGMHLAMIRVGLADSIMGVILIHLLPTLPYSVRVLKAGFDRISPTWIEQGAVLGVNGWKSFITGILPMMLPSLRTMAVLTFVISLSQYVLTAIIGGGRVATLPLIYYPYFSSTNEAVVAGFSVLFALLPIVFLLLMEATMLLYMRVLRRA
ncbi:ABC transporter permease subunit [Paenalkalicoccus suaedae]|uniref:ABC transporter permease subunit n=1 Tax=Paenalkalicoccus suaedae TaxID=2592382 RepID=A0A859FJ69_9BACI|nr:ABC transporter permease subunit [Paenalkalicoccus suaedae]QKS72922.1 ABC transporter permease subunit [Paenalkalicoccus suaedae]